MEAQEALAEYSYAFPDAPLVPVRLQSREDLIAKHRGSRQTGLAGKAAATTTAAGITEGARACRALYPLARSLWGDAPQEMQAALLRMNPVPRAVEGELAAARSGLMKRFERLFMLRVPKSGSTSLARMAMLLTDCRWRRPNCGHGGPRPCPHITGCVGHTNYRIRKGEFDLEAVVGLASLRYPPDRCMSAFLKPKMRGPKEKRVNWDHNNPLCFNVGDPHRCFREHLADPRYTGIFTKMLTGYGAYANYTTCDTGCPAALDTARANMRRLRLVLLMEAWSLSVLAFYAKVPEARPPIPRLFSMHSETRARPVFGSGNATEDAEILRAIRDDLVETYGEQIYQVEARDMRIYQDAVNALCDTLRDAGLWASAKVRSCWQYSLGRVDSESKCSASTISRANTHSRGRWSIKARVPR